MQRKKAVSSKIYVLDTNILLHEHLAFLSFNENNKRIINSALYLQKSQHTKQVVLVTKDINMRLKPQGAGLAHVEDDRTDQMVTDIKYLSKGYHKFYGNFGDEVKSVDSRTDGRDTIHTIKRKVLCLKIN
jgi:PhoH-like ATPase